MWPKKPAAGKHQWRAPRRQIRKECRYLIASQLFAQHGFAVLVYRVNLKHIPCQVCDHVHLLVEYPPKVAVSNLVNSLKGVSSRLLRKERPDIQKRYWKSVLGSPPYFASSCGGAPISIVRRYIEQQHTPH